MESLGQKLREAREKHNYNLEQVARDTNISKSHLAALEEENFGAIPGDTYVLGFLRNYAEYLGLNPEELVSLYRNLRIQEQPMPMSELLQGAGPRRRPRVVAVVLVVAVLAAIGVFLLVRYALPRRAGEPVAVRPAAAAPGEYVLTDDAVTRWYSQGESVSVPLDGEQFRVTFAQVGDRLTLKVPGGTVDLRIGQTRSLDLDADSIEDIRVQLNDLDVTGSNRRANLSFFKLPRTGVPGVASAEGGAGGAASVTGGQAGAQAGQAASAGGATAASGAAAPAAASGAAGSGDCGPAGSGDCGPAGSGGCLRDRGACGAGDRCGRDRCCRVHRPGGDRGRSRPFCLPPGHLLPGLRAAALCGGRGEPRRAVFPQGGDLQPGRQGGGPPVDLQRRRAAAERRGQGRGARAPRAGGDAHDPLERSG
jgi:cytoskeleton protein RodZ